MGWTEQSLTLQPLPTSHSPGYLTSRETLCQQYFTIQIFSRVEDLANTSPATDPAGICTQQRIRATPRVIALLDWRGQQDRGQEQTRTVSWHLGHHWQFAHSSSSSPCSKQADGEALAVTHGLTLPVSPGIVLWSLQGARGDPPPDPPLGNVLWDIVLLCAHTAYCFTTSAQQM